MESEIRLGIQAGGKLFWRGSAKLLHYHSDGQFGPLSCIESSSAERLMGHGSACCGHMAAVTQLCPVTSFFLDENGRYIRTWAALL